MRIVLLNLKRSGISARRISGRISLGSAFFGGFRFLSSAKISKDYSERIRNFGIIAHIDAGKTTVSERLLFLGGFSSSVGSVDEGSTVMDYLEEEKERGITIQSACVTFSWNDTQINLIDTPGHVDFTFEVERSIRALDGAVAIIDGVSGVQSQTETVWRQAAKQNLPIIVFANKMDRLGASLERVLQSLSNKFSDSKFVPIQLPIFSDGDSLKGVVDLISMEIISFSGVNGENQERESLTNVQSEIYKDAKKAREVMIEAIAENQDEIMEKFINEEEFTVEEISNALRHCVLQRKLVPVLCGSALRNIGIPLLLDAVVKYLPNPKEVSKTTVDLIGPKGEVETRQISCDLNGDLCAHVFKVIIDPQRGPITFVKVVSGKLALKNTLLVSRYENVDRKIFAPKERISKILELKGGTWNEIEEAPAGSICALVGCRFTRTGDTLSKGISVGKDQRPLKLLGITPPEPVFFASVIPDGASQEKKLVQALSDLHLEDPSLTSYFDNETNSHLLRGMGELHLEIAFKRLTRAFGVNASIGPMRVAYREKLLESIEFPSVYNTVLGGNPVSIEINISLTPNENIEKVDVSLNPSVPISLDSECWLSIYDGIMSFAKYASAGFPLCELDVEVLSVSSDLPVQEFDRSVIRAAAFRAISKAVLNASSVLMEPVMNVEVNAPESSVGNVLSDLSKRRGHVEHMEIQHDQIGGPVAYIRAQAPLSELIGYATSLRSMTKGSGTFSMVLDHYRQGDRNIQALLEKKKQEHKTENIGQEETENATN